MPVSGSVIEGFASPGAPCVPTVLKRICPYLLSVQQPLGKLDLSENKQRTEKQLSSCSQRRPMSHCSYRTPLGKPTSPSFTAWWNSLQVVWRLLRVVRSTFDASTAAEEELPRRPALPPPSQRGRRGRASLRNPHANNSTRTSQLHSQEDASSVLQFADLHGFISNEQGLAHSITCIRRMSLDRRMATWSHILEASAHFCHQRRLPNTEKHRTGLAETE